MNVEIETNPPQFLFWEYLFQNFGIVYLQCSHKDGSAASFSVSHKKFAQINFLAIFKMLCVQGLCATLGPWIPAAATAAHHSNPASTSASSNPSQQHPTSSPPH
jgi:hypothetical protein